MNNKKLVMYDGHKIEDDSKIVKGQVKIYQKETGKLLFEGWNKVILPGSIYTACKHFDITPKVKTPSYNDAIGLDNSVSLTPSEERDALVCLFAVGIDGCGPENSQVYDVDYSKWIAPENLVPFRYQISDNDLEGEMRNKYFGRKALPTSDRIAYYFKAFEIDPQLHQEYVDGTEIDENIYTSENTTEVKTYVELKLSVTKEDCRDFFIATSGINDAKINTISLLTAFPKDIEGYTYYQGIRPLTKYNFPNESLIDLTKGIDIVYNIYY